MVARNHWCGLLCLATVDRYSLVGAGWRRRRWRWRRRRLIIVGGRARQRAATPTAVAHATIYTRMVARTIILDGYEERKKNENFYSVKTKIVFFVSKLKC
jgi:hypothetical protein